MRMRELGGSYLPRGNWETVVFGGPPYVGGPGVYYYAEALRHS